MRLSILLLAAALLTGCVSTSTDSRVTFTKPGSGELKEIPRDMLVGTWYGNQPTKEGTTKEWITRRTSDGEFQVRFREKRDGLVQDETIEVGDWGLTYDLQVVITRGWLIGGRFKPAPAGSYYWDAYRVEHIDRDRMVYLHHGTGHRYEVRRVADDFAFPQ